MRRRSWALGAWLFAGCANTTIGTANDSAQPSDAVLDVADVRDVVTEDAAPDRPAMPPDRARPVAPLSGARVTQRRPTLRWARASEDAAVRVEVCADRACTRVEAVWEGDGTRWRPDEELATGVHFWRVRGAREGEASAVWSFVVPSRSGTADTSWNALTDFNGDGRADVLVLYADAHGTGVGAYLGQTEGWPTKGPGFYVEGNADVTALGDLDGDGYGDLGVLRVCLNYDVARLEVHRGGPDGPSTEVSHTIAWRRGTCMRGRVFVGVGDINGDGYGDLAVESPELIALDGRRVEFHLGAAVGLPMVASTPLEARSPNASYGGPRPVGDVNGDGFADIAVRRRSVTRMNGVLPGQVWIHLGGASGVDASPAIALPARERWDDYGGVEMRPGPFDLDGDGLSDVLDSNLVTSWPESPWQLWWYRGAAMAMPLSAAVTLDPIPLTSNSTGRMAIAAGDYDGDGRSDLVVLVNQREGVNVQLFHGGEVGRPVQFEIAGSALHGASAAKAVDVNGDGADDLVLSLGRVDSRGGASEFRISVFAGGAWPLGQTEQPWLVAPGRSIALAW